ncbi:CehA/McbA family metallohydrolase [Rhizohabitans arisaemae]|uniref:CehA/McbA family metallohydrolase n=1 Tax=Rhizohabitans arisaemae TaxID=2720610 RepID=UPI0024B0812B|nr:CehA/McbA family metallohydrolase [Rhizohabitans arisaemae]
MCTCHEPTPAPVARMLAGYRRLLAEHGPTWGQPKASTVPLITSMRFASAWSLIDTAVKRISADHPRETRAAWLDRTHALDFEAVLRDTLDGALPPGLMALRLLPGGVRLEPGTARPALPGQTVARTLLVDSRRPEPATVAGEPIPAYGARLIEVPVPPDADAVIEVDGRPVALPGVVRRMPAARLRLRAGMPCRWSVSDDGTGEAWYPEGAPAKRDWHGHGYFHGDDLLVAVPAAPITVTVTRGMEYGVTVTRLTPGPGEEILVESAPERLYDPVADGWYGGDTHVHMNFAGDTVADPHLAEAMQHGEDLHVLNLLAGNYTSSLIFEREALDVWAGRDLPWSDSSHIARMGVEYRAELYGHMYAFGPATPPRRFYSGHGASDNPEDWPGNSAACRELRGLGAVLGYSHPFYLPMGEDDPPAPMFDTIRRSAEARGLVVDAALGLVDSLDVLTHASPQTTAVVFRRLLGAGNRLAATAGTDVFLSYTRCGTQSNPPGWARVYARVDGRLSAESFARAIRAGATIATNGPWLELTVDGHGPGDTLDLVPGTAVLVRAKAVGPEVGRVEIRTADGVQACADFSGEGGELQTVLTVTEPTYIVAVAEGPAHPRVLGPSAYAHSSPVYLDVAGAHVARQKDLMWCLDWLDRLEQALLTRGVFHTAEHLDDVLADLEQARAVYQARLG